jgi:hypothetical protein
VAVLVTAFLLLGLAAAIAEPPQHVLPAGTAVVFVSDGHLDVGARAGSLVAVHLRDPLVLDGVTVAAAGAKARLLLGGSAERGGRREAVISLDRFTVSGGTMPVIPVDPLLPAIEPGTAIEARTQGIIERVGDRYSVRIPFPFALSTDRPASYYTPTPARTAPPNSMVPRRRSPSPTPSPTPSPAASPNSSPDAGATSVPSPNGR